MELWEKTTKETEIYAGRIITVNCDDVALPGGSTSKREVVYHHGGVCILPFDGTHVYLVDQFRYPYREVVREAPAGKLEKGENPLECGKRELKEEIGATAGTYSDLGKFYPTPGYCAEIIHLYLAEDLQMGVQQLDEDEFLNVVKVPLEHAVEAALNGELRDGKTQAALLKLWALQNGTGTRRAAE